MSRAKKAAAPEPTNTEIRTLMLRYFYDRNRTSTSVTGTRGSAVKISDVKSDLKARHGLTQQQVQSNLTYLLSQGWIEERPVAKQFATRGGTLMPAVTTFYQITAAGMDKIDGPGEFTMSKFQGIKIEATGQNIITVGEWNQVNAQFGDLGRRLEELRKAVVASAETEERKVELVSDIDTVQSQLAKPHPNQSIIAAAWTSIKAAATIDGCTHLVEQIIPHIASLVH